MKMEARQLRYFVAVAEELHFGRAALRLHMSQPPLSQQIRQLEEQLGVQLFERNQRSVRLTYAGEVLLGHARTALASLEEAVDTVRAAARGEAGFLRIGCTAASAYSVVPALLRRFKQQYPRVEVVLHERFTADQLRELHEGRLDVGLVRLPAEQPGLVTERLLQERLVVAIPADHPLAAERIVDVGDLQGLPFVGFTRDGARYFHDMIDGMFAACRVTPLLVQRATQMHVVVALVSAGLGLAVVPDTAARVFADRVVFRPLRADRLPQPELHLCWRREGPSPLVRNFVALARELADSAWV